jgi:hypothetical protein
VTASHARVHGVDSNEVKDFIAAHGDLKFQSLAALVLRHTPSRADPSRSRDNPMPSITVATIAPRPRAAVRVLAEYHLDFAACTAAAYNTTVAATLHALADAVAATTDRFADDDLVRIKQDDDFIVMTFELGGLDD